MEKICEHCKTEFEANRDFQRFCAEECQMKAVRARRQKQKRLQMAEMVKKYGVKTMLQMQAKAQERRKKVIYQNNQEYRAALNEKIQRHKTI